MSESATLREIPALDESVLDRLGREVEDASYPTVFASRYQQMLPKRVGRIAESLGEGDLVTALDAVLSLRVASATVGTCQLVAIARDIETSVRELDLASARTASHRLAVVASRAETALDGYLQTAV
ncbi:MAG: hypothetical protein ACXVD0_02450 [Nocardioides sp.]